MIHILWLIPAFILGLLAGVFVMALAAANGRSNNGNE